MANEKKSVGDINMFDQAWGFLGGLATYKIMKKVLYDIHDKGGAFTRTGCFVLEASVAIVVWEVLSSAVRDHRMIFMKKSPDKSESTETTEPTEPKNATEDVKDFVDKVASKFDHEPTYDYTRPI